jgi:hypothetical protein
MNVENNNNNKNKVSVMRILPVKALLSLVLVAGAVNSANAQDVIGVHRWYENGAPDPVLSISVHESLTSCKGSLRSDVREQQAAWEQFQESYQYRFSTHGCFNTATGESDEAGQYWIPDDEIYWVNPTFIIQQCHAAGGDEVVCAQVTDEFIKANRNGDATGEIQAGSRF